MWSGSRQVMPSPPTTISIVCPLKPRYALCSPHCDSKALKSVRQSFYDFL